MIIGNSKTYRNQLYIALFCSDQHLTTFLRDVLNSGEFIFLD